MKSTKYLKSCFIALVISLLYVIFVTRFIDNIAEETGAFIVLSTFLIFMSGAISPLTLFMSGKYTTSHKEAARPDISVPESANQTTLSAHYSVLKHDTDSDVNVPRDEKSENSNTEIPTKITGQGDNSYDTSKKTGITVKIRGSEYSRTSQNTDIDSITPAVATPDELALIRQKNRVKVIRPAKMDNSLKT